MRRIALLSLKALAVILCVSCGFDTEESSGIRVHIRNDGAVQTTYELENCGRILRSATTDEYGVTTVREYLYDDDDERVLVSRDTPLGQYVYYLDADEAGKSIHSGLTGVVKSVIGPHGTIATFKLQYLYAEDGSLKGMIQTDSHGNVQARYAEAGE